MKELRLTQDDIGEIIGRKRSYVGQRIRGEKDFEGGEQWKILSSLDLPRESIYDYFPPPPDVIVKSDKPKAGLRLVRERGA